MATLRLRVLSPILRQCFKPHVSSSPVQLRPLTALTSSLRPISTSNSFWSSDNKIENITDSDKVTYIDLKNNFNAITFAELKDMAETAKVEKGRYIVHVTVRGIVAKLHSFRIVSDHELEALIRKSRFHGKGHHFSRVDLDPNGCLVVSKRVKQKNVILKVGIEASHIETNVTKIKAWMAKGYFVQVKIKIGGNDKSEAAKLEQFVKDKCFEKDDVDDNDVELKKSQLITTVIR
jgi:hypothetical protein